MSAPTVTGTDPVGGDDGRARGRVAPPLLAELRGALADITPMAGAPAFVLIRLDETGLRGIVVDAEAGDHLVELREPLVEPAALDRMLADHLVRTGRVPSPSTRAEAFELLGLMPLVRIKLAGASGAFVIGRDNVGLVQVTHHDLDEALAPALARAASLARSVAIRSPERVTAVVVMPGHSRWPGLLDGLTATMASDRAGHLPVIALRAVALQQGAGRHDLDGAGASQASPVTSSRRTRFYLPAPPVPDPVEAAEIRKQNRKVLAGAIAVALIAIAGAAAWAAPWKTGNQYESRPPSIEQSAEAPGDQAEPDGPVALDAPAAPPASPKPPKPPKAPPKPPPPIDTEEALAPVVAYEAPPPPPSRPPAAPAPPPPGNAPAPVDGPVVIPLPGLPPIVLP